MKKRKRGLKDVFIGDIVVPDKYTPGIFKTHEYRTFRLAPTTDNDNRNLGTLIKAFYSILNGQMFKNLRDGQPSISFEILGTRDRINYQITVPKNYATMMKEKIQATFPGGGVKEYEETGWPFTDDGQTLVAGLQTKKEPYFPIAMDKDSMIAPELLHALEELKEGEKAFVQILLEPLEHGWQTELEQGYERYLNGDDVHSTGGILQGGGKKLDSALTSLAKNISTDDQVSARGYKKHREIREFRTKLGQSGFHVAVRVLSSSSSYSRRNDIVEGIAGAFKTGSSHNIWELSPILRKGSAMQYIRQRKMPLMGGVSLLCEDEVKTLLRLPTKETETTKLERMSPDEERIDERLTRDIIPVGRSVEYDSEGKTVGFSIANPDTSSKGRLWIAPPGSGKTTAVKIFKNGAMDAGHGGSLFDVADGSLYYEAIRTTPPEHRDKLVLVNFANERYPHIFNFNSLGRDADTVGAMFAEFFEVFFKTASNYRMNSILRKAAMTSFINPDNTFLELLMLMKDEDFRRKFLPTIRKSNPDLFLWWKQEFPKLASSQAQMQEILQPILYRLDELQYNKRLGPIFCGTGGKLEIYKWMNEGKWVLYNLSNGVFLENEQRMMMAFLNYAYWSATLAREKIIQNGDEPVVHHKMYDEPQTYMNATPVTKLSISKSRKYRVSDNFFIQSPSQVIERDKELWSQILDMNPHILIGGGLNDDNLKLVAKEFNVPLEELKKLQHLEYHWYFKTYVGKTSIKPFIFDGSGLPKNYDIDPQLIAKWRSYFAPEVVEEVRKDVSSRALKLTKKEYEKLLESYDDDDDEEGVPIG